MVDPLLLPLALCTMIPLLEHVFLVMRNLRVVGDGLGWDGTQWCLDVIFIPSISKNKEKLLEAPVLFSYT